MKHRPKVHISSLHNINPDHYTFVRNTRLPPDAFRSQRWYNQVGLDGWVFIACLLAVIVAFIVAERPL